MANYLNANDLEIISTSLVYSKYHIENYGSYPSYEYKLKELATINEVSEKVNLMKKELK